MFPLIIFITRFFSQVQEMRENLNEEWLWFQSVLKESKKNLDEHKKNFKDNLVLASQEFKLTIQAAQDEFNKTGHKLALFL